LQPHLLETGPSYDIPLSFDCVRNTSSRHCAWDRPRHSMLCVTIATSSTSGQGRPRYISIASPPHTFDHVGAVANLSQRPRSPPRSSNLDFSNPSGSKSLFDIGSRVSTSGSLTRQVIRLTTRNVRRGGLFCHSNRAADQETASQRRAHRGGKAGIERRISWALEQIYLGCVGDLASQNLRDACAGPFCNRTLIRGP
jgi:hypothetical protein